MGNRVEVNIAGYVLTVETERSVDHMERLTGLLNDTVRDVQKTGGTANYLNVILLAAMRLADEVIDLRGEKESQKKTIEEKSRTLIAVLDDALK